MALIGFIGDISIDRCINISSSISELLKNCDYVIGNLEGPILQKKRKKWKKYSACISNKLDIISELLPKINLTHVSIFNNHIGDYGIEGIQDTFELLDKLGIAILKKMNIISNTKIINTGLLEYSGYFYNSILSDYGYRLIDLLLINKKKLNLLSEEKLIINGHFGIEKIRELSDIEINFFHTLMNLDANLLIRHQPHFIQDPFQLNKNEIYSSIGDFCFSNDLSQKSEGLLVIYNEDDLSTIYYKLFCDGLNLKLKDTKEFKVSNTNPIKLSKKSKIMLKDRIYKEYRVLPKNSLKKIIKNIIGMEDYFFSSYQFSTDHIQPYIINELFNYE